MTNASSPITILRAQARRAALAMKTAEKTGVGVKAGAREKPEVKFAVVMDDKVITIEMEWTSIRDLTVEGLTTFIVREMQKEAP